MAIWEDVFVDGEMLYMMDDEESEADPDAYSDEEKTAMVMNFLDGNPDGFFEVSIRSTMGLCCY
jgi:hypothetical protein